MKKFLCSILMIIMILGVLTTKVSALSFTPTIAASKQTVPEQQEFTVTIKVSNLDVGANGINVLEGTISYDTAIFETITESSIEGLNSWQMEYDESSKKIKAVKTTFVKTEEQVFQITLKTKSGVTGKEGVIAFSNVTASNSESKITANDVSTTIKVGTESEPSPTPISINSLINVTSNTTTNTNTNTNTATNTNTTINSIINSTNTSNNRVTNNTINNKVNGTNTSGSNYNTNSSNQNLAYAGVEDGIVKLIFGIVIIAVLAFWRYHSLKEIK